MKKLIAFIKTIAGRIFRKWISPKEAFTTSAAYWQNRYKNGRNSGNGSYGQLATFKAEIINDFVREKNINSVIEFGCGDGNQLKLGNYKQYLGFDISEKAIRRCQNIFKKEPSKSFSLLGKFEHETADLSLSLDVIFHLIEEENFVAHMQQLFKAARHYVIIYSSNTDKNHPGQAPHFKNREFTKWIEQNKSDWQLIDHIPNKYPFKGDEKNGSVSEFYIYGISTE